MTEWLLLTLALTAAPTFEATTVDGRSVRGQVVALSPNTLRLSTASGEETVATGELLSLRRTDAESAAKDISGSLFVGLTDGSRIASRQYVSDGKSATVVTTDGTDVTLPIAAVRSVQFVQLEGDDLTRWQELLTQTAAADLIGVRKKDASSTNYLEGAIGAVSAASVEFKLDGELIPVGRDRVQGLIYLQPAVVVSGPLVADREGSVFVVKALTATTDGLSLKITSGVELQRSWSDIQSIDYSSGKLRYLSDVEPAEFSWTPYLAGESLPDSLVQLNALRKDRARQGGPLILGERTFKKGIGLSSRSQAIYAVPAGGKTFQASVGIDRRDGKNGQASVIISVDNKRVVERAVAAGEPPIDVNVSVVGARRLTISVDYGQGGDAGDHVVLGDARILQ